MTKKNQAQTSSAQARALVDLPQFGASAGCVFEAAAEEVASLVASGQADDHPDAIAHAKE